MARILGESYEIFRFLHVVGGLLPISLTRDWIVGDAARWWFALGCVVSASAAALLVVSRLSLVLPAGATFGRPWALTRGNALRILAGSALSSGPVFVVDIVLNAFLEALPNMSAGVPSLVAVLILSLVLFGRHSFKRAFFPMRIGH